MFSQQTVVLLQADPLPTPMTLIGEQSRPTRALTSSTTTPMDFRMPAAAGELACSTHEWW